MDCLYWELYNQDGIRLLQCCVEKAVAKSKYKRSAVHMDILSNQWENKKQIARQTETEGERTKKVKHILVVICLSSFLAI